MNGATDGEVAAAGNDHEFGEREEVLGVFDGEFGDGDAHVAGDAAAGAERTGAMPGSGKSDSVKTATGTEEEKSGTSERSTRKRGGNP